uniref:Uncharacterized protein n=1 Tax=Arundo donax TaxID=35708 RepID=A0A0A8Z6E7_ARUDO
MLENYLRKVQRCACKPEP